MSGKHIVFIAGELNLTEGGTVGFVYHLMRIVRQKSSDVKISFIGSKSYDHIDSSGRTFLNQFNITYVGPDPDEDAPPSVHHAYRDVHTYYDESLLESCSHVIVLLPHGAFAMKDDGLLSKLYIDGAPDPEILLINSIYKHQLDSWNKNLEMKARINGGSLEEPFPELGECDLMQCFRNINIRLVLSLGYKTFRQWEAEWRIPDLPLASAIKSENAHVSVAPLGPLRCVNTNAPSELIQVFTLDCEELVQTFGDKMARCLEKTAKVLNDTKKNTFEWTIFTNQTQQVSSKFKKHNSALFRIHVRKMCDLCTLEKELSKAHLVIQHGSLHWCGYSGLETIMSGIPTLYAKNSDLHIFLREIYSTKADIFSLANDEGEMEQKIRSSIIDREDIMSETMSLADRLEKHQLWMGALESTSSFLGIPLICNNTQGNGASKNTDVAECRNSKPTNILRPNMLAQLKLTDINLSEKIIGQSQNDVKEGVYKDRKVAVKCIHMTSSFVKQAITEYDILKCLSHENVVTFFGACFEKRTAYIVLEYVPNNMADEIEAQKRKQPAQKLQTEKKIETAVGCCSAIQYLHDKNVVHQDIKPANILLTADLQPKLCDFGISRVKNSQTATTTQAGRAAGTFQYMPPESMEGAVRPQPPSDIWSLSCTLVHWFNKKGMLWANKSDAAIVKALSDKKLPEGFKSIQNDELKEILRQGLDHTPKSRPTAAVMLLSLKQLIDADSNHTSTLEGNGDMQDVPNYGGTNRNPEKQNSYLHDPVILSQIHLRPKPEVNKKNDTSEEDTPLKAIGRDAVPSKEMEHVSANLKRLDNNNFCPKVHCDLKSDTDDNLFDLSGSSSLTCNTKETRQFTPTPPLSSLNLNEDNRQPAMHTKSTQDNSHSMKYASTDPSGSSYELPSSLSSGSTTGSRSCQYRTKSDSALPRSEPHKGKKKKHSSDSESTYHSFTKPSTTGPSVHHKGLERSVFSARFDALHEGKTTTKTRKKTK